MEYRQTRARVPLLDTKSRAQKSVNRDVGLQENPVTSEYRDMTPDDGYRPGVFRSDVMLHPDMQRHDGWRPAGSFSPSSYNGRREGHVTLEEFRQALVNSMREGEEQHGCRFTIR
ncbi:hypothetical protein [Streptomyces sp. NPDC094032]|uniref:hypothetical protein n=1 Tax=Streptomyces sp. NPDC094032 TaxID=3155308 RepID=UPI00331FD8BE